MFAKQTVRSASLALVLVGCSVIAHADPAPAEHESSEARPPTGTFTLDAGFSSDEGFIAHARVSQDSLFHTGHALSLEATLSRRYQLFAIHYATPDLGGGLRLETELFNDRRQMPGFVRQSAGGGLMLSKRVTPHLTLFAGYRLEVVSMERDLLLARSEDGGTLADQLPTTIAMLRAGFQYDSIEHHDGQLSGTNAGVMYEVADHRVGSEVNFDRIRVWANHHHPIGPMTMHLSASLTQLEGNVPLTERLFLDGSNDIRGYFPGQIGPIDGLGRPVGGMTKLVGRAELEVPLVRRIGLSAVGFMDAGAIGSSSGFDAAHSVGVGLLWHSPIGPLRFDWALPLDNTSSPRFLFSVGAGW